MRIDVIIPLFNGEKFVRQAIESVLSQSLKVNKIFVVDDGSTDSGVEVVKDIQMQVGLDRLVILTQSRRGPSAARNLGIRLSEADWIGLLDADDVWMPNKLERQIEALRATRWKNLALVYCDYSNIDADGVPVEFYKMSFHKGAVGRCWEYLLNGNFILASSSGVLIKRIAFDSVGFFDETLKSAEDWDMWIRISEKYDLDFVPEVLVLIRRHSQNSTNRQEDFFWNDIAFLRKYSEKYPLQIRPALLKRLVRTPSVNLLKAVFKMDLVSSLGVSLPLRICIYLLATLRIASRSLRGLN